MTREVEYKQTGIYFPLGILSEIDEEANNEGMSRSGFIRYLFKFYKRRKGLKSEIKEIKEQIKSVKADLEGAG